MAELQIGAEYLLDDRVVVIRDIRQGGVWYRSEDGMVSGVCDIARFTGTSLKAPTDDDRDAWRDALIGLTPGGSEYTTPEACVAAVRDLKVRQLRTIGKFRLEADRLRADVDELVEALGTLLTEMVEALAMFGTDPADPLENMRIIKQTRAVLAKHRPAKEPQS